jgi:hypothetical protein
MFGDSGTVSVRVRSSLLEGFSYLKASLNPGQTSRIGRNWSDCTWLVKVLPDYRSLSCCFFNPISYIKSDVDLVCQNPKE